MPLGKRLAKSLLIFLVGIAVLWFFLTGYCMFACGHMGWGFEAHGGPWLGWFTDAVGWALFMMLLGLAVLFPVSILASVAWAGLSFAMATHLARTPVLTIAMGCSGLSGCALLGGYWTARLTDAAMKCSIGF